MEYLRPDLQLKLPMSNTPCAAASGLGVAAVGVHERSAMASLQVAASAHCTCSDANAYSPFHLYRFPRLWLKKGVPTKRLLVAPHSRIVAAVVVSGFEEFKSWVARAVFHTLFAIPRLQRSSRLL